MIDIIAIANSLAPVESAFYLMTRISYLQAFANGNKRTARLAANLLLLLHGLLPISFVDFSRAQYIQGMAAFYELNNISFVNSGTFPKNPRAAVFVAIQGYVTKKVAQAVSLAAIPF